MPQEKYPVPPCRGNPGDVTKLSRAFVECALALQGTGADHALIQFIVDFTGIVAAFTERLVDLRNNDITEETIALLLEGLYPTPEVEQTLMTAQEYRGIVVDRRSGKYAEASSVPPEHRAALSQTDIGTIFTATTPGHIRHDGGGPARFEARGVVECDGVCLDRHSGKFALAVHVPPEHRGILTDENICLIRFHLQTDLLAQDE